MSGLSIWRWAITEDLERRLGQLVVASDDDLVQLAAEMAREWAEDAPSLDQIEQETEARLRAMDLPPDIKETMLRGFKTSMQEARAEAAAAEKEDFEFGPDADGRMGVALASSHMFHDDPYASVDYEDRDQQVADLLARYRMAISAALGDGGQSLADFLGLREERLWEDDVLEVLVTEGLDAVIWVWSTPDRLHFLGQWQEDKELPIDLEYGRAPRAVFERAKAQVTKVATKKKGRFWGGPWGS